MGMKKEIFIIMYFLLIPLFFTGCMAAYPLLAVAPSALQIGASAYAAIEKADINAAVSPGVTKEELNQIKHIALVFGGESPTATSAGGDITTIVGDNLSIELMKLGFEVSDRRRLQSVLEEQGLQMSGLAEPKVAIKIGKMIGAQAIVTGAVTGGQTYHFDMFGRGRMSTIVQNASLKIIGVEKGTTLMAVTISYKKGQNPKVAAESIAAVLKAKLQEPFVDVKEVLKKKK